MIFLPANHPLIDGVNICSTTSDAYQQSREKKTVWLLNLMPHKDTTDANFVDVFATMPFDIEIKLLKFRGYSFKTTSMNYVNSFYLDIESEMLQPHVADGLIVTGAPLEQMAFEDCHYWEQLCGVMDWAQKQCVKTLYICWAAQAALYHFFGISKEMLPDKCFGIFPQNILQADSPLLQGMQSPFPMPHSRHTHIAERDVLAHSPVLNVLACGAQTGTSLLATSDYSRTFILGHLEYDANRLNYEYQRDLTRGLAIIPPYGYFTSTGEVDFRWQQTAHLFYCNWLAL